MTPAFTSRNLITNTSLQLQISVRKRMQLMKRPTEVSLMWLPWANDHSLSRAHLHLLQASFVRRSCFFFAHAFMSPIPQHHCLIPSVYLLQPAAPQGFVSTCDTRTKDFLAETHLQVTLTYSIHSYNLSCHHEHLLPLANARVICHHVYSIIA